MATRIRFACGSPEQPRTAIWRVVVNKNDIYIGAGAKTMSRFKISLHERGVWVVAATSESGILIEGNRRVKQWTVPKKHQEFLTRGHVIQVPFTAVCERKPLTEKVSTKGVTWFELPCAGKRMAFIVYIADPGFEPIWLDGITVLDGGYLARGDHVFVVAALEDSTPEYQDFVDKIIRQSAIEMEDPNKFVGASLIWYTQSADELKVPVVIELPGLVKQKAN